MTEVSSGRKLVQPGNCPLRCGSRRDWGWNQVAEPSRLIESLAVSSSVSPGTEWGIVCLCPPSLSSMSRTTAHERPWARLLVRPLALAQWATMTTSVSAARLRWRVVVRTEGKLDPSRPSRPLSWHLASCAAPDRPDAHCLEGRRLLASGDDPDGHCLASDVCPRCALQPQRTNPAL